MLGFFSVSGNATCNNLHLLNSTDLQCEIGPTVVGQFKVQVSLNEQPSNVDVLLSRLCKWVELRVAWPVLLSSEPSFSEWVFFGV